MLTQHEKQYIYLLWNRIKPIAASRIYKTTSGDNMILSGILHEYSDSIVSMDLRQRRAKTRVPICGKENCAVINLLPMPLGSSPLVVPCHAKRKKTDTQNTKKAP